MKNDTIGMVRNSELLLFFALILFSLYNDGVDGRILDPVCCDPADHHHHVSDQLLRWHFRQSVLANMRGAGEPVFEHDFPPGTGEIRDEMITELRSNIEGPLAQERFELELSYRLGGDILPYLISFILCKVAP